MGWSDPASSEGRILVALIQRLGCQRSSRGQCEHRVSETLAKSGEKGKCSETAANVKWVQVLA